MKSSINFIDGLGLGRKMTGATNIPVASAGIHSAQKTFYKFSTRFFDVIKALSKINVQKPGS